MSTETVAKPPRVIPSAAERNAAAQAANEKARKKLLNYEGAYMTLTIELCNRPLIRLHTRTYFISMRNWQTATSVARSALQDNALATATEMAMLKKVKDTITWINGEIAKCNAIALDANVDFEELSQPAHYKEQVQVIGPVAMQMHSMFKLADKYLSLMAALYAFGQVTAEESNNSTFEVKKKLEGVGTSIRNRSRQTLQTVNEKGRSRPGFKAVPTDVEDPDEAPKGGEEAEGTPAVTASGGDQAPEAELKAA